MSACEMCFFVNQLSKPILILIKRIQNAASFFRDIMTTHESEHSKTTRN